MAWKFNSNEPIYLQIVNKIKLEIISGTYPPDAQLPSVRQLADNISVNPNTVQRAMQQLEDEGLVFTQGTTGRFISTDQNLPDLLKNSLAKEKSASFVKSMNELGLSFPEIITLLEDYRNEGI